MISIEDYPFTNREKRMQPKRSQYYCWYCDRSIVSDWSKCSVCGKRNGIKRRKK